MKEAPQAQAAEVPIEWEWDKGEKLSTVARNVSTRYLGIGVEALMGIIVLPFNVNHLGASAYGLWMLTASVTAYFSVLDLGYGGSLVRFVAKYRARRDSTAINEILSTLFYIFTGIGVLTYLLAIGLAFSLGSIFHLSPQDAVIAKSVLLIVAVNVSLGFSFSVFGGVINGFQRYHLNNAVGALASLAAAIVNILVLEAGYGLVAVVAATTTVRILSLIVYRWNAYYVFPALRLRLTHFRIERLKEVTGFSVFILLLDWANKVNYSVDTIVIGGFISTAAVATWTVAQRLAEVAQRITNQLNDVLFPAVVDSDESKSTDRLRRILVSATRLSLGTVLPVCVGMLLLAGPLVTAWVGPRFAESVRLTQILAVVVLVRVGTATSSTVLKGAGGHKLLTAVNLSTAAVNLLLSVILVRSMGLVGVALGTLIPVTLSSLFILYPAACRRASIPVWRASLEAGWPALWPAIVMTAWLLASRGALAHGLVRTLGVGAIGGVIYVVLFVGIAIPSNERRVYIGELRKMINRRRHLPVAA